MFRSCLRLCFLGAVVCQVTNAWPQWLTGSSNSKVTKQETDEWVDALIRLSPEESRMLQEATSALELYTQKPNTCYHAAAMRLRTGCNELDNDIDLKVLYAIHLTKCDISVAAQKLPRECQPLESELDDTSLHPAHSIPNLSSVLTSCVNSLSHIGYMWTAYNGHSREVKLMCFAVRYDIERKNLEEMYRNVTSGILKHHLLLRHQNEMMVKWRQEELDKLEEITKHQEKVRVELNEIQKVGEESLKNGKEVSKNLGVVGHMVNEQMGKMKGVEELVTGVSERTLKMSEQITKDFQQQLEWWKSTSQNLDLVRSRADQLHQNLATFREESVSSLSTLQNMASESMTLIKDQKQHMETHFSQLGQQLDVAKSHILETARHHLEVLKNVQSTANQIFEHQIESMKRAQQGIEKISDTTTITLSHQESLMKDMTEFRSQQKQFAEAWAILAQKAEQDLGQLLDKSNAQIRMLHDANQLAHDQQAQLLGVLTPVATFASNLYNELQQAGLFFGTMTLLALSWFVSYLLPSNMGQSQSILTLSLVTHVVLLFKLQGWWGWPSAVYWTSLSLLASILIYHIYLIYSWSGIRRRGFVVTYVNASHFGGVSPSLKTGKFAASPSTSSSRPTILTKRSVPSFTTTKIYS